MSQAEKELLHPSIEGNHYRAAFEVLLGSPDGNPGLIFHQPSPWAALFSEFKRSFSGSTPLLRPFASFVLPASDMLASGPHNGSLSFRFLPSTSFRLPASSPQMP